MSFTVICMAIQHVFAVLMIFGNALMKSFTQKFQLQHCYPPSCDLKYACCYTFCETQEITFQRIFTEIFSIQPHVHAP